MNQLLQIVLFMVWLQTGAGLMCGKSWKLFKDRCYRVLPEKTTFIEAMERCHKEKGMMGTIKDEATQYFIFQAYRFTVNYAWIGLRANAKGIMIWSDGSVLKDAAYSKWDMISESAVENQYPNRCTAIVIESWVLERDCDDKKSVLCMSGAGAIPPKDVCKFSNGGCEQECAMVGGERACSCKPPLVLANKTGCGKKPDEEEEEEGEEEEGDDRSHCQIKNGGCDEICKVVKGKTKCGCDPPGKLVGRTKCVGNPCKKNNGKCDHICEPISNTAVKCSCLVGFLLAENGALCTDIDECLEENGKCEHNCTNTPGDRTCWCRPGFTMYGTHCMPGADFVDEALFLKYAGFLVGTIAIAIIAYCIGRDKRKKRRVPPKRRMSSGSNSTPSSLSDSEETHISSGENVPGHRNKCKDGGTETYKTSSRPSDFDDHYRGEDSV